MAEILSLHARLSKGLSGFQSII